MKGNEGVLVFLSREGRLLVGYLGTEPSLFIAPPIQARDLDYEAAEKELNQLRYLVFVAHLCLYFEIREKKITMSFHNAYSNNYFTEKSSPMREIRVRKV